MLTYSTFKKKKKEKKSASKQINPLNVRQLAQMAQIGQTGVAPPFLSALRGTEFHESLTSRPKEHRWPESSAFEDSHLQCEHTLMYSQTLNKTRFLQTLCERLVKQL